MEAFNKCRDLHRSPESAREQQWYSEVQISYRLAPNKNSQTYYGYKLRDSVSRGVGFEASCVLQAGSELFLIYNVANWLWGALFEWCDLVAQCHQSKSEQLAGRKTPKTKTGHGWAS